jgi:hypothetical protein
MYDTRYWTCSLGKPIVLVKTYSPLMPYEASPVTEDALVPLYFPWYAGELPLIVREAVEPPSPYKLPPPELFVAYWI